MKELIIGALIIYIFLFMGTINKYGFLSTGVVISLLCFLVMHFVLASAFAFAILTAGTIGLATVMSFGRKKSGNSSGVNEPPDGSNDSYYFQMIDQIEDYAILRLDQNGMVMNWNKGAEKIKGYKASEIIGKSFSLFYTKEDIDANIPQTFLDDAKRVGKVVSEGWRVKKNGELFWARVVITNLRNEIGESFGFAKITYDLTEKRKADAENLFLASIASNLQDPIISTDNEYKIVEWNHAAERLLGWKREEVLTKLLSDFMQVDYLENSREEILKGFEENGFWQGEVVYHTKSGKPLNVLVTVSNILNGLGELVGNLALVKDITSLKYTQAELLRLNNELEEKVEERTKEVYKSEQRFRFLIENNDSIIALIDSDYKTIYRSPSAERVTGWAASDAGENGALSRIHPADMAIAQDVIKRAMEKPGVAINITLRAQHKNGKYKWLEGTLTNLLNEPNVGALVTNLRDITEIKEAEIKLNTSERKFRALIENAADIISLIDANGIVTYVSPAFEKVTGFYFEEIVGKKNTSIMHPEQIEESKSVFEQLIANPGKLFKRTNRFKHKDGHYIWVEGDVVNLLDDPDVNSIVSNYRDVTLKRHAEDRINKYMHELERSNKELEQFAYIASHDLQEPLRMVGSYVQLLEKRYKGRLDTDADEFIQYAVEGATRMKALINDLLNYSRTNRETTLTKVDVNVVVREALINLKKTIEDTHAHVTVGTLPTLLADKTQVLQVFQNLIINGIKFHTDDRLPHIHIDAINKNNEWLFSVADNGIGIAPEYKEKVFVIFKQLNQKSRYSGTGIGLAIAKKIIEGNGGSIWFESEVGKGTTFYFTVKNNVS